MSDLRAVIESEYDDTTRGEWANKDEYNNLKGAEKTLAEALFSVFDEVGPFDETDGIYVRFKSEQENEDSDKGVRCENCVYYASENVCQILSVEIEPGGICRFSVIPPGYVGA
jgi:hypothetical protein